MAAAHRQNKKISITYSLKFGTGSFRVSSHPAFELLVCIAFRFGPIKIPDSGLDIPVKNYQKLQRGKVK